MLSLILCCCQCTVSILYSLNSSAVVPVGHQDHRCVFDMLGKWILVWIHKQLKKQDTVKYSLNVEIYVALQNGCFRTSAHVCEYIPYVCSTPSNPDVGVSVFISWCNPSTACNHYQIATLLNLVKLQVSSVLCVHRCSSYFLPFFFYIFYSLKLWSRSCMSVCSYGHRKMVLIGLQTKFLHWLYWFTFSFNI